MRKKERKKENKEEINFWIWRGQQLVVMEEGVTMVFVVKASRIKMTKIKANELIDKGSQINTLKETLEKKY